MRSKVVVILCLIFIASGTCFTHANEYSQNRGSEYTSELGNDHSEHDNMYAVSEGKSSSDEVMDHSLGRSDFMAPDPTHKEVEKKIDHEEGSHSSHTKEIKISEHEWVSTSQKGYGPAAGITLAAGLFFGIIMIRRS
jgi:hypothetical protein